MIFAVVENTNNCRETAGLNVLGFVDEREALRRVRANMGPGSPHIYMLSPF